MSIELWSYYQGSVRGQRSTVTKTALLIILFAPIAAIVIGLIAIYYAFKVDQEMFSGELDFDTVDF